MPAHYTLVKHGDDATITVYVPGTNPLVAQSDHPNFERILDSVVYEDLDASALVRLFDIPQAIASSFDHLTSRVTVANRQIYLDGDLMHDALTTQILRVMDEGGDYVPLVNFFEKILTNPNEHSREQLYNWLDTYEFSITPDGDIVGYKGCVRHADGVLHSMAMGTAIVNGKRIEGKIPNPINALIEMPRSEVVHDPENGCSIGLHVGTYDYAQHYASGGALLEVHVNPRDVVSVPTDCNHQKMRVCRYRVVQEVTDRHKTAVVPTFEDVARASAKDAEEKVEEKPWEPAPIKKSRTPTAGAFSDMQKRAKRRRRNFVKYATKHGPWQLVGEDPNDRKSWVVIW